MNLKETPEYKAGYDCGLNGANTTNSHYSHFATEKGKILWEKGKAAGDKIRQDNHEDFLNRIHNQQKEK